MFSEWIKSNKKLNKIILGVVLFFTLILVLYALFGHALVKMAYEGRAPEILNSVIEGQSEYAIEYYFKRADSLLASIIFFLMTFLAISMLISIAQKPPWENWLKKHPFSLDDIPAAQTGFWIAIAAGLSIYAELMIIRLHSSYFQLFAYFKNVSLLSCFLGLGIGYTKGPKRLLDIALVLPFLALQIAIMYVLRFSPIAELLQNPISEQVGFGIGQADVLILFTYSFVILTFVFNALCFIPLGHLISGLMMRQEKLLSYSWNLIGSMVGILLFSFVSFIWAPPTTWIILAATAILLFLRKDIISIFVSIFATAAVLIVLGMPFKINELDVYSPYQILTLVNNKGSWPTLKASNTFYQPIVDLRKEKVANNEELIIGANHFNFPYYIKPKPEDVLIVGSGTGNDVAAAVRNGAGRIDAVEIDPAILKFGKQLHPESPYQSPNVNAVVDDARAFIRRTDKKYDLIVYGVLDSHGLLTSKSGGIRLDSYVYTVEAIREARAKLKKGGVINLGFVLLRPSLGRKIFLMLREAFDGLDPAVYQTCRDGGPTIFLIGEEAKNKLFSLPNYAIEVTDIYKDPALKADIPTDDWPFIYMPEKRYPVSYIVIILIMLIISITFIRRLAPKAGADFSTPCFFLGAGFMLIETKGITELALVYGSTWIVISIVIAFILLMAFFANLLVMKKGAPLPLITYSLVFLSVGAGFGATFINLGAVAPWLSRIYMPLVLTLPLFFSGLAFSAELTKTTSVSAALSSNLLGAMLGGFFEYNSMYFGFRSLYLFAIIMYAFAFFASIFHKKIS
ncbi:MAG: hypothetical protein V2A72_02530 [Candidatus Omnitrophota bacterium]